MIRHRAADAGIKMAVRNRTFRAASITACLKTRIRSKTRRIINRESPRTTKL
jgi:hypothetical protein